jgi:hypothetical protein
MILDAFRCTAQDLTHHSLKGWSMWLRLEGDSDDPAKWHPVKDISVHGFRTDTSQPFVKALTVSFHDETPDLCRRRRGRARLGGDRDRAGHTIVGAPPSNPADR